MACPVPKSKTALPHIQNGYIGDGSFRKMPQFFPLDGLSRSPSTGFDYMRNLHTHGHKSGHDVQYILHGTVHATGVQIGADGIGEKTTFYSRQSLPVIETCASITYIKNDPALLGFQYKGL